MRLGQTKTWGREIATALAVFAMLLQVMLAPAVFEQHALSAETDYGLTLICGSAADHVAGDPAAPSSDHHAHECPCCFAAAGAAVLPQTTAVLVPATELSFGGSAGWNEAQVFGALRLSGRQQARAPPSFS